MCKALEEVIIELSYRPVGVDGQGFPEQGVVVEVEGRAVLLHTGEEDVLDVDICDHVFDNMGVRFFLFLHSSFHFLHVKVPFLTLTSSVIFPFQELPPILYNGHLDNILSFYQLQMADNSIKEIIHIQHAHISDPTPLNTWFWTMSLHLVFLLHQTGTAAFLPRMINEDSQSPSQGKASS